MKRRFIFRVSWIELTSFDVEKKKMCLRDIKWYLDWYEGSNTTNILSVSISMCSFLLHSLRGTKISVEAKQGARFI
jgi:hypothetical protein